MSQGKHSCELCRSRIDRFFALFLETRFAKGSLTSACKWTCCMCFHEKLCVAEEHGRCGNVSPQHVAAACCVFLCVLSAVALRWRHASQPGSKWRLCCLHGGYSLRAAEILCCLRTAASMGRHNKPWRRLGGGETHREGFILTDRPQMARHVRQRKGAAFII